MNSAFGQVMQHGYVVPEVEQAARERAGAHAPGPFHVFERMSMQQSFRGTPVRHDADRSEIRSSERVSARELPS